MTTYRAGLATIHHGDALAIMARMPDASVDSIVTDPPYGLGFMGKAWDNLPPGLPWARECLRVLKPGGHLLAFGGTRTWHRLACAVEDAGFEMRDSIAWLYGSGFPKSLDVSKQIDKLDAADERLTRARNFQTFVAASLTAKQVDALTGTNMGYHLTTHPTQPSVATADLFDLLRPHLPPVPEHIEALVAQRTVESKNYAARVVTGTEVRMNEASGIVNVGQGERVQIERKISDPHTPEAEQWQGWGTALKPGFEPIVVARKPLAGTVAANVLAWGTGALNIDGGSEWMTGGRWPANVALDESQAAALDQQSGTLTSGANPKRRGADSDRTAYGEFGGQDDANPQRDIDTGGASRFFYCAKAPKSERPVVNGKGHPTVKPLTLMRWLVRLATPPGGVVLDPFAGSGTTVEAALLEGMRPAGIEREAEYLPHIEQRIIRARAA